MSSSTLEKPKSNDLSYVKCKQAMRTSSAFCVAGWLAIYLPKVPVFIAEIACKNLRGVLTTLNQLMIVCGVSVSFIIGTMLSWRALALTGQSWGNENSLKLHYRNCRARMLIHLRRQLKSNWTDGLSTIGGNQWSLFLCHQYFRVSR
ncbi:unnamed protein product [Camellia sinensis]